MAKYNVLICGPIGTGKTYSARSLIRECKIRTFVLATEPGIDKILGDIPCSEGLHWHYVRPAQTSWETMIRNATLVNTQTMEGLQKMSWPNRSDYQQFLELLGVLTNFKCDRCGETFGAADTWGEDSALVIDGLSGVSTMARDLTVGAKPILTQPEWGVAMRTVETFVKKCCSDLSCTFVLIGHLEREKDELSGGTQKKVSTLGNKLAPELLKPFDEVLLARRDGKDFFWSTNEFDTELKTRVLGWSATIKPSFALFPKLGAEKS